MPHYFAKSALLTIVGALTTIVFLEVLLRALPVSTSTASGYYLDPMLLTYPKHHRFTVSSGWNLENARHHTTNNYGFLAARDFKFDPTAIAVIGDSYAESSMLDVADQPASAIERRLSSRSVYSLGGPGSSLLDYAERLRFAATTFGTETAVVLLENGDLVQSLCGSGNIHAACLDSRTLEAKIETQAQPGTLKRALRHSALAQYLFSQLKVSPSQLIASIWQKTAGHDRNSNGKFRPTELPDRSEQVKQVSKRFVGNVRKLGFEKIVFVWVESPRPNNDADTQSRKAILDAATELNATVIDGGEVLAQARKETGLSTKVSPRDGHVNALGWSILATHIAQALIETPLAERPSR